jgi:hypothetical protein
MFQKIKQVFAAVGRLFKREPDTLFFVGGELSITQEADTDDDDDELQTLSVKVVNNGAGYYYRISTNGWALSLDADDEPLLKALRRIRKACDKL